MPKKAFIDRKTAKHYHVVHRSQRDPLINDPEASQRVLKEVIPSNLQKHKTPEELRAIKKKPVELDADEIDRRVTQAAMQGIFFDDVAEYDYTQHLRTIGESTEAVFLEAPTIKKEKKGGDLTFKEEEEGGKKRTLIELPADVLPSQVEMRVGVMGQSSGLDGGLQPDMDPRIREVLEALDDEEYVDNDLDEDFFEELDAEGDPYVPEEEQEQEYDQEIREDGTYDWEAAFRNFKRNQQRRFDSDEEDDDDVFERRTKQSTFSVSSSAMHRNAQLTLLDDRFEKIEEEYMRDDDEDEDEYDEDALEERNDFDAILDDFLEKYEIVGRKMMPKLEGDTTEKQLDTIREQLANARLSDNEEDDKWSIVSTKRSEKETMEEVEIWERPVKDREVWDCESVLSTYSNLENHPKLISDRAPRKKVMIDPKTGMPVLVQVQKKPKSKQESIEEQVEEEDEEAEEERVNLGAARSKGESKEEKKARKAAVKEAKKNRREAKKNTKQAFKNEETRQRQRLSQQRENRRTTHLP